MSAGGPGPEAARSRAAKAVAALTLALAVVSTACGDEGEVETGEGDPETIVEEATEEDFRQLVVDEPFEGTAVVTEVVSPRAFRLFDTLVVSRQQVATEEGERVRVRGTIRDTTIAALEAELGVSFDDAVAGAHDGGLLIVGDDIEPVEFPG